MYSGEAYAYNTDYLIVDIDPNPKLKWKVSKAYYLKGGYTYIDLPTLVAGVEFLESEKIKQKEKFEQEKLQKELKGIWRERMKALTDENIELRYEREKLYKEIENLQNQLKDDTRRTTTLG